MMLARDDPGFERIDREIHPNSIAVLPFENQSGDPEQQYFVSGMQDALISGLMRNRELRVISKTSTLQYRDANLSLPAIGSELGVSKLIEAYGSISPPILRDYVIDVVFEIGVALIGAGITAYLLGIVLSSQQENAKTWRQEIRRQIRAMDDSGSPR